MSTEAGKEAGSIPRELWAPGSPLGVYAILDGARDVAIHEAVKGSDLPHTCLYAGQLPRELVETAPYLVRLEPGAPFTAALLERGWGRSWGIFALSTATLEEMRRHLRKLIQVQDGRGRTLIFRFYDPRVLRAYLPTCDEGELGAVFGPTSLFVMEDDTPTALLRFHRDEKGRLGRAEVALAQAGS